MKPIGTILRNARRQQALSIEELNSQTKIRVKYIEAIENNDWESLPGSTYAHGFIKRYAEAVNLDPAKVHALFRREYKNTEKQKIIPDGMINAPLGGSSLILTIRRWIAKLLT